MRYTICLALLLLSVCARATNYELSEPVDLPLTGWNKVLQLSNGNTMLFHFEARKPVIVKLFDSRRKEIASVKYIGKLVDNNALERSALHGIYEVGGEAVIFLSQDINNSSTLVRICFNIDNAKLAAEKALITSASFKKRFNYSLAYNKISGGYAVFCMLDLVANFQDDAHLEVFDEKHNKIKHVVYKTQRDLYDEVKHINTCIGNDGTIAILLNGSKIIKYPSEDEHSIITCYLAPGEDTFCISTTKLPKYISTQYGMYAYNDFSKTRNIYMVGGTTVEYKRGLETVHEVLYNPFMLMYNKEQLENMDYAPLECKLANIQVKEKIDTSASIKAQPIRTYINKYGVSTIISEEVSHNIRLQGVVTSHCYVGDIVVTQVNETGKEMWSTIIPNRQYVRNLITASHIRDRGELTYLFRHADPTSDWLYQFASFYSFMTNNGDCYVIHNNLRQNFNKTIADKIIPMSSYTATDFMDADAVFYKITRKREVSQSYLLEESNVANYSVAVESADYHESGNTFAAMFIQKDGGKYIHKLAWRKMD